ncbi:MAG: hypothetical protein Q7S21_00605 [archaeon]|nr:hypothetical protein [archaeon]
MSKAQVSLEFLILLAGFFSVLAITIPASINLFEVSVFALDARNASIFLEQISSTVEELSILEDGSLKTLSFNPMLEWRIVLQNNEIRIEVFGEKIGKQKSFLFRTNENLSAFSQTFSSKSKIVVSKIDGIISIKNS